MHKMIIALMLCFTSHAVLSQSFGVVGEVFQVTEMSLLAFIQSRLGELIQSGEWDTINQHWQQQVERHADRPTTLKLPRTIRNRTYFFRPEIILDRDIKDAQGRLLYPAGTRVNALERLSDYSPCWLFFNANLIAERQWAQKEMNHCAHPKMILTGGSVHDMELMLNTVIYFDQGAVLTKKLGIQSTPARVTRYENALKIEERVIKENGDAL